MYFEGRRKDTKTEDIIYTHARVKGEILQKNTCLATQKNILNYFFLYP